MSAPKTNAERQRDLTTRREAAGLKQVRNLWAYPDDFERVKAYVAKLCKQREREKR